MGAQSLETRLRRRLLGLVAPAIALVGLASVAVTWRALDVADRATARTRAEDLARELRRELDEGDAPEAALREVAGDAETDGLRVALRLGKGERHAESAAALPAELEGLGRGACASARDDRGARWHACAAGAGELDVVAAIPVDAHAAVVRELAGWMLGIVGFALLAVVAAARLAVRRPLGSLRQLVEWAERVAGTEAPLPAPAADTLEIQRLGASCDALVKRLFEALSRERTTSAHMAHELRTPLTSMRAELEALGAEGGDAGARLLADVERLARVVDAILVLSAPKSDGAEAAGVVNIADVARALAPPGAAIDAPDEALVDADAHLVELALHNLLENAEKYGGHPAHAIEVTRAGSTVRLAVIDDGPGLDEAARARMFERYWRGSSDGAGSGLGLALVRAVAERYGGHAEATPNADGRGLTVAMTFGRVLGWH